MPSYFRLAVDEDPTTLDKSTNAPSILAINGFFCGLTVVVMVMRLLVRSLMLKTVGIDDYIMAAATVSNCHLILDRTSPSQQP